MRLLLTALTLALFTYVMSGTAIAEEAKTAPMVKIETNLGVMTAELFPQAAPVTVENFLSYVAEGYYDGLIFHRVIRNFMVQGGGYDQDMTKRPTRDPIALESNNGLRHKMGTLSMARTKDLHSATSQFFINLKSNSFLNYRGSGSPGYVVFGRLTKGFSVLNDIGKTPTAPIGPFQDMPKTPIVIKRIVQIN